MNDLAQFERAGSAGGDAGEGDGNKDIERGQQAHVD